MKITHITTNDFGGAGGAAARTHKHLLNAGIDSNLLVLNKKNDFPATYSYKDWMARNNRTILKRIKNRLVRKYYFRATYGKIKDLSTGYEMFSFPITQYRVERHPIVQESDLIVLHWIAGFINFPTFFRNIRKPIFWRLPDMFPFTGGYHYEIGFPMKEYQKLIEENLSIKQKAITDTQLHLIPLCRWMNQRIDESIFKNYPRTIIPNGIDAQVFQPRNKEFSRELLGLPKEKIVILFVSDSATNKRKGLSILIEALKKISNPQIHLAVLGSNAHQVELPQESFTPLGKINSELLISTAYDASDLFVIPSLEDNLPNTVIESIACGTPVVGFDIGGIPDMIKHGKNGLLCSETNADSLAASIKKALDIGFDSNWIRRDAVSRFDQSVQAQKYIKVFNQALK